MTNKPQDNTPQDKPKKKLSPEKQLQEDIKKLTKEIEEIEKEIKLYEWAEKKYSELANRLSPKNNKNKEQK